VSDTGCDTGGSEATYYLDEDGDGYGSAPVGGCSPGPGRVELSGDCDDTRSDVYPGAEEACGLDNNCDGVIERCRVLRVEEAEHLVPEFIRGDVLGDLDGDGLLDLGVGRPETTPDGVRYYTDVIVSGRGLRGRVDVEAHALATTADKGREGYYTLSDGNRVGDLNADGLDDLYVGTALLFGPLPDGLSNETEHQIRNVAYSVGVGDVTGDGVNDILKSRYIDWGPVMVSLIPGPLMPGEEGINDRSVLDLTYDAPTLPSGDDDHWGTWYDLAGDTNGDGVEEAVVADVYDDWYLPNDIEFVHHFFSLDARGALTTDEAFAKIQATHVAGIGDTDGDGYEDVIAAGDVGCPDATCLLYGPLTGADWATNRSTRFVSTEEESVSPALNEWGDLDGDGRAEISVQSSLRRDGQSNFHVVPGGLATGTFTLAELSNKLSLTVDAATDGPYGWLTTTRAPHQRQLLLPT
jgi:hypothetical protein